jgi:hypothetical protein
MALARRGANFPPREEGRLMKRLLAVGIATVATIAALAIPSGAPASGDEIHLNYSINNCLENDAYWAGLGQQAWGLWLTTPSGVYGPFKVRVGVLGDCVSHVAQHQDWTSFGSSWWFE